MSKQRRKQKQMTGKSRGMHHAIDVSGGDEYAAGGPPLEVACTSPGVVPQARPGTATIPGEITSGRVPGLADGSTMSVSELTGSAPTPTEFKGFGR